MSGVEPIPTLWGVQIAQLHKKGSLFLQEALEPWGLGTGLHPYLLALEAGPVHQEALSQALSVDKANTARAVAKLEALGLVTRRSGGADKRIKVVQLTDQGLSRLFPIKAALADWEARLRTGLAPQQVEAFTLLLGRVHGG